MEGWRGATSVALGALGSSGFVQLPDPAPLGTSCVLGSFPACSCVCDCRDELRPCWQGDQPGQTNTPVQLADLLDGRQVHGQGHRQLGPRHGPWPLQSRKKARCSARWPACGPVVLEGAMQEPCMAPSSCEPNNPDKLQTLLRTSMPLYPSFAAPIPVPWPVCCLPAVSRLFRFAFPYFPVGPAVLFF